MLVPRCLSLRLLLLLLPAMWCLDPVRGAEPEVFPLWPEKAPGEQDNIGEERDVTTPKDGLVAGRSLIRLGNVGKPTITLYRPDAARDTGTAVLVCPGGAYHILAMDLEGTEVCEWLNSIGITGVLLKYRVPKRNGLDKHTATLQDAQRALGLVRHRAQQWKLDPKRLGVLGFSAGGHLAAALSLSDRNRSYPILDDADKISCRPDFAVLVYPAYLTVKEEGDKIAPELNITSNAPPTFIAMSQDDPVRVENALFYTLALQKVKVPVELHLYPKGGHGYGLRRTDQPVTTWPQRAEDWLRSRLKVGR